MKITGLESNEELLKILGGRVKDYRINARITQEKLAEDTGLSLRTIVNIETGKDVKLELNFFPNFPFATLREISFRNFMGHSLYFFHDKISLSGIGTYKRRCIP